MSTKSIVLYMHVHQPYRISRYNIFDISQNHDYYAEEKAHPNYSNQQILSKVSEKSYLPTNKILLDLLEKYPEFKISLSITGVLLDQLLEWDPETLHSFQALTATGRVEILAETYFHSLAFLYAMDEFEEQVKLHRHKIRELFGLDPTAFRNTELAYNNQLAQWAENMGYKAILAEGWDPILGWRSPNFLYQSINTNEIKLLLKNYRLSDDIAFRFNDRNWNGWPLTVDKFTSWANANSADQIINIFLDYETFGEHQWIDSGILEFLEHLPENWLKLGNAFATVSEAAENYHVQDQIDIPEVLTWADTERDLSAWRGNPMQNEALNAIYRIKDQVLATNNQQLIETWRQLQSSDHFYYMSTKWFNDGDIHAYFSPYESPYEAFLYYMNVWHDLNFRILNNGNSNG